MTKQQKVKNVTDIVEEARKHYTQTEFANMVFAIWQGLQGAEAVAVEGNPPP
jgi:hypothetical protein